MYRLIADNCVGGPTSSPGTLIANGGAYSAGIGAGPNQHAGTITIESGIIIAESNTSTASGGAYSGAGIGGGGGVTGGGGGADAITICGTAHVTATSHGNGAGIGGAGGGPKSYNGLAGGGDGGIITVTDNATVIATSKRDGAGIGGGGAINAVDAGNGGTITIQGDSTVIATSEGSGAGIGGGTATGTPGAAGSIVISSTGSTAAPTVTASSAAGADIGAGRNSNGDPGSSVKGDIIITSGSVYAPNSDIVTNDGGIVELEMQTVTGREANEFIEWPVNDTTFPDVADIGSYTYTATASSSGTAYLWLPYLYEVTYDFGIADGIITDPLPVDTNGYVHNDSAAVLGEIDYTLPGFRFLGWMQLDGDGTFLHKDDIFTVTGHVTLVAQWAEELYTVTYHEGDGSGMPPVDDNTYIAGEDAIVLAPGAPLEPPAGKHFAGWLCDADGEIYFEGDTIEVNSDITLTAQWADDDLTVTFDLNGGVHDGGGDLTQTVPYGGAADEPITYRDGYMFVKWDISFDNVTSDITVTAQWTKVHLPPMIPNPELPDLPFPPGFMLYTVKFDLNGGVHDGGGDLLQSVTYGGAAVEPITHRDGYVFDRWDKSFNYVTQSITVKAIWTKLHLNTPEVPLTDGKDDDKDDKIEKGDHDAYILGYPDSSVKPDNSITRAEASAIFFRLLNDKNKEKAVPQQFNDVNDGAWYEQYVNYLASIGVVTGYPDGSFKPDQAITRAEFVAIASKLYKADPDAAGDIFSDLSSDHWACNEILSAYARGWVIGYPDGTFSPDSFITRAETAKIINVILDRKIDSEALARVKNPYNDITSKHWAYPEIIEASFNHTYTRDKTEIWARWN